MLYSELVEVYEQLYKTKKRLEKTECLSVFLNRISVEEMERILILLQGRVFPQYDTRKIGVAARLVLKAIAASTGISVEELENNWRDIGDLGEVSSKAIQRKKQVTLAIVELTTDKVFENIQKLALMEGIGTVDRKVGLIAELLTSAKPAEAKYIVRTLLEDLRVGLGEGTLRDAIVWAFFGNLIGLSYDKEENELVLRDDNRMLYEKYSLVVQEAQDISNDFALVAKVAKTEGEEGLKKIALVVGRPVKVMLAQKVKTVQEGFETVGKPAAVEYKYDGFRMLIHKDKGVLRLFTRKLEDVTTQFPDVVSFVTEHVWGDSYIIDCEAVGYSGKTGRYLPFQEISQRIRRKYDIERVAKEFPVEVNIFDVLFYEGDNLLKTPFLERRKLLEEHVKQEKGKIILAKQIITESEEEAQEFYVSATSEGNEGVMFKNVEAPYKPGSRVGFMVKLKPVMDMLDLVIVGAEWGEGKRSGWLTSFTIACRESESGELKEVGKVATGLKEKDEEGVSFNQLTELLKPLIISEKGKDVRVKPEIVIEVSYEEVQQSPTYDSHFALRFPRFVRLRNMERNIDDINTLEDIENLFYGQKKR